MKQLQRVLTLAFAIVLVGAPVLAQQPQTSPGNLQPKTSPDTTTVSPQPRQPSASPTVSPFPSPAQPSASPSTPGSSYTSGDRRLNTNTSGQAAPAEPASKEECKDGWQKHGFKDEGECVSSLTSGKDRR